jgi:hypothetical protein
MAELKFKGPFHFDHLYQKGTKKDCGTLKSLDISSTYGIYIWGFLYDLDTNSLINNLIDFSTDENKEKISHFECNEKNIGFDLTKYNWQFLPIYVGRARKGSTTIGSRLFNHHDLTNLSTRKYTRLEIDYYKKFSNDKYFPINVTGGNWILKDEMKNQLNGKVSYFNNDIVLKRIYSNNCEPQRIPNTTGNEFPIDLQNFVMRDQLKEIISIDFKNNFWFCYLDMTDYSTRDIEIAEIQTFYSLKGKTISKTENFSSLLDTHNIVANNDFCRSIFKHDNTGKIIANPNFLGYNSKQTF